MFSLLDFRQYFDGEQLDGRVCLGERTGADNTALTDCSGLRMIFIYSSLAWCDIESEWWILYLIFKILQVTPSRQLQLDGV